MDLTTLSGLFVRVHIVLTLGMNIPLSSAAMSRDLAQRLYNTQFRGRRTRGRTYDVQDFLRQKAPHLSANQAIDLVLVCLQELRADPDLLSRQLTGAPRRLQKYVG